MPSACQEVLGSNSTHRTRAKIPWLVTFSTGFMIPIVNLVWYSVPDHMSMGKNMILSCMVFNSNSFILSFAKQRNFTNLKCVTLLSRQWLNKNTYIPPMQIPKLLVIKIATSSANTRASQHLISVKTNWQLYFISQPLYAVNVQLIIQVIEIHD